MKFFPAPIKGIYAARKIAFVLCRFCTSPRCCGRAGRPAVGRPALCRLRTLSFLHFVIFCLPAGRPGDNNTTKCKMTECKNDNVPAGLRPAGRPAGNSAAKCKNDKVQKALFLAAQILFMGPQKIMKNKTPVPKRPLQSGAIGTPEPTFSRIKFVGSAGFRFRSRLHIYYYRPIGGFRNPEPRTQRRRSRRGRPQHFVIFSRAGERGAPARRRSALKESGRDPPGSPAGSQVLGIAFPDSSHCKLICFPS